MKNILVILLVLICSCSTMKNKKSSELNTETNTKSSEVGVEIIKREGSVITYEVPKITFKDTIIEVKNKNIYGTNTLRVVYDKDGAQRIECLESELDILKKYFINKEENKKEELIEEEKTKDTQFKPIIILYIFLGLAFLMFIFRLLKRFGF